MKTLLLVVGRTVEPHFITAINDYVQRTRRYLSFDIEVIPELKNTKSLSTDVQKEKEADLILKALQPGDVVVLLDEGGKEMRSVEFAEYMKRKMIPAGVRGGAREVVALAHDLFPPDGTPHLRGAALPGDEHPARQPLPPRIKAGATMGL